MLLYHSVTAFKFCKDTRSDSSFKSLHPFNLSAFPVKNDPYALPVTLSLDFCLLLHHICYKAKKQVHKNQVLSGWLFLHRPAFLKTKLPYKLMVRLQDNSDITVPSVVPCTVPMSTSYGNSMKTLPLSNEGTEPL